MPISSQGADYLRNRPDVGDGRIGAIGFSIERRLLEAAARSATIRAVVSESAGGRVGETDASGLFRPLVDASMLVMTTAATVFQNRSAPRDRGAHRIDRASPRVPHLRGARHRRRGHPAHVHLRLQASRKRWRVPGSTPAASRRPAEYERQVIEFVDRRCWIAGDLREGNGDRGFNLTHDTIRLKRDWLSRVLTGPSQLAQRSEWALHVADDNFLAAARDVGERPPR